MRRIAIVGSGIAGLLTAHGLRRAGHEVTLYSDRTGRQWLEEARPTGAAGRFHRALAVDRELGLAHWDDHEAYIDGVTLAFCAKRRNRPTVHGERHSSAGEARKGSRQIARFVIYYAMVTS